MKKGWVKRTWTLSLGVFLGMILLHLILRVPSTEGFNPSDEGVVLAQSWRILNGEIPHVSFISIRPAGSGLMHLLDFLVPGPLVLKSRWISLVEYLVYSILFVLAWIRLSGSGTAAGRIPGLTGGLMALSVVFNLTHYTLYTWTTVDALFWFSIALYAWSRYPDSGMQSRWGWLFLSITAASISALCRQTFALPLLVLWMVAWFSVFARRKEEGSRKSLVALLTGLWPLALYDLMISLSGGANEMIAQLTGRTELWETGFAAFGRSFWTSPVLLLFAVGITSVMVQKNYSESGRKSVFITRSILIQKCIILISILFVGLMIFIDPDHLFFWTFQMFWLGMLSWLMTSATDSSGGHSRSWFVWVVLIAWTSSISLGDNGPVFASGLIAGGALWMLYLDLPRFQEVVLRNGLIVSGSLYLAAVLFFYGKVQGERNYRDFPASQLIRDGSEVFPDLKGIRLNDSIYSYFSDIKRLYSEMGKPAGRFAVWPDNALVYQLLESPNPFPVDWMQQAEFAGSESRLFSEVEAKLQNGRQVILVEKVSVKRLPKERIGLDWNSGDYPYLELLNRHCREVPVNSNWFRLFVSK